MRSLMTAIIVITVIGCAGSGPPISDSLPPDYVRDLNQQTGIAVGSVTSPPDPKLGWQAFSLYHFERLDDPAVSGTLRSGSNDDYGKLMIPFAHRNYPPDYDGCALDGLKAQCGRLFAMELHAGEYAVSSIGSGDYLLDPTDYRFSVQAGEVVYLGNLNSRICVGYIRVIGYGHVIIATSGEVQDQFERDWPLLVDKYPFLEGETVDRRLIEAAPWRIRRGENRREPWVPEYGWDYCEREALQSGWPGLPAARDQ